jgi:hypothetical protein
MPLHEENGRTRWTRIVYVIELDPEACLDSGSHCPGDCGKTPVYVGETCHTALERFMQHKLGYKASRWVRDYGLRLRPRLAGSFGEMATVAESQAAEAEIARRLSLRGNGSKYCVYGGH